MHKKILFEQFKLSHKKILAVTFVFASFCLPAFSQKILHIDYYGIVSTDIDDNMAKMTSDLYFSQLNELNSYQISDKRKETLLSSEPDSSFFSDNNLSVFVSVSKKNNSTKWISTINVYDSSKKAILSETKEFDSFYKILMEPKASLEQTITSLLSSTALSSSVNTPNQSSTQTIQSTEFLSGTWSGEDSIDKIVIMRGGRGFVIFKNGASMNITVETSASNSKNEIIITQKGKANASFFPELPREAALKEAVTADPIEWTLQLNDDNTLTGIKKTLVLSNGSAVKGTIDVTWKRKS